MFNLKVLWMITFLSCDVLGMNSKLSEKPKTEGRQLQSFFPQEEPANPNFQPSPSDVYFVDGNNQVQDTKPKQFSHNPKFSPNLQADLYTQQFSAQQYQKPQPQYQYVQQSQPSYTKPEKPFYPTPDGSEVNFGETGQQQYSPQSQQYVDNANVYASQPQFQSQSQSPYDQGYSQVVSGGYLVGNRPPVSVLPQHRPTYSLYTDNQQHQYGGNSRPVYQSQSNYHLRPPANYGGVNEGGIMESLSNFISNIGQSTSELLSGRPPINQYQPPPSVSAGLANRPPNPYNQPFGNDNAQYGSNNPALGGNPVNPVNQFSKAIEEITRNDDYQCIPKVICQMVGSQRRQPSLLNSPIFTAIISAVPSTSAGLVYGRAALLGLISGEHNCQTAYPRCPRNEDELLHYLNNHRGGFFRFFNGGAAFGDQNYQYNPNPNPNPNQYQSSAASNQYYHPTYQNQPPHAPPPPPNPPSDDGSLQSNLAALQNVADAINNGGGINLSNLGANANLFSGLAGLLNGGGSSGSSSSGGFDLSSLGANAALLGNLASLVSGNQAPKPSKAPPDDQGQSLTELVGNLLTGFVGQRFAGRKINKRSINTEGYDDDKNVTDADNPIDFHPKKMPKKISVFKIKLASTKGKFKFPEDSNQKELANEYGVEGRILNSNPTIYSDDEENHDKFVFSSNRNPKQVPNNNGGDIHSQVHFDNNRDEFRIISNHRSPKLVKFQGSSGKTDSNSNNQHSYHDSVRFDESSTNRQTKMIFPDRTGTGNLRFDHQEFNYNNKPHTRYGKILSYGNKRPYNDANQVTFAQTDRYSTAPQQTSNSNPNQYYDQNNNNNNNYNNQRYPTYNRYTSLSSNRERDDSSSQNIYVTNAEGKTVYYINAQGNKVYV